MSTKKKTTIDYIKNNANIIKENKETLFFGINVFIKEPLPENVSLNAVLKKVEKIIPRHLVYNIEVVYVGEFKLFDERKINAMYQDGALYISNDQDDEDDMVDDIIHEIAHATEEKYWSELYGDETLEEEFLTKRMKLFDILESYDYNVVYEQFVDMEYSGEFDQYLYNTIGYEKLEQFSIGLFINPYSITSLREYFGVGFEKYYLENRSELANVCPILYNKVELVATLEERAGEKSHEPKAWPWTRGRAATARR